MFLIDREENEKLGKMNILKAQSGTSGLINEKNDQTPDYSRFAFYGIHTLNFVDRVNSVNNGPANLTGMPAGAALESEVEVQAAPSALDDAPRSAESRDP